MSLHSSKAALRNLLIRPVISEKAGIMNEQSNTYVFYVQPLANKVQLAQAFELAFPGRQVLEVRTSRQASRPVRRGRIKGVLPARKRAMFRILGEPIQFSEV